MEYKVSIWDLPVFYTDSNILSFPRKCISEIRIRDKYFITFSSVFQLIKYFSFSN